MTARIDDARAAKTLKSLRSVSACRRCGCLSCGRDASGENHNHVCTGGEQCRETAERLKKALTAAQIICGQVGSSVSDLIADRADYKARIEDLENVIRTFADALDTADRIIERALGTDVPKEWHRGYKACAKARAQIPTPSPPEAPASDTRALAVEIVSAVVSAQARMQGAPYADEACDAVEAILRKALPAAVTHDTALRNVRAAITTADTAILIDTLWMPDDISKGATVVDYIDQTLAAPAPDTDRKLARAVEALEKLRHLSECATPGPWSQWGENAARFTAPGEKGPIGNVGGWEHPRKKDDGRGDQRFIVAMENFVREALTDLTTAPAEAEMAPDIKPIVEAMAMAIMERRIRPDFSAVIGGHWAVDHDKELAEAALDAYRKSKEG